MKVLLDTVTFLWICLSPQKLSRRAAALYEDPSNEMYLSVISVYEIVVKSKLGKLDVGEPLAAFFSRERELRNIQTLGLDEESALVVERLPLIHADPFDRLLSAQSIVYAMTILTPDPTIAKYPVRVIW